MGLELRDGNRLAHGPLCHDHGHLAIVTEGVGRNLLRGPASPAVAPLPGMVTRDRRLCGAHTRNAGSWAWHLRGVAITPSRRPGARCATSTARTGYPYLLAYASRGAIGIRVAIKRKSHQFDEQLLRRAQRTLGTSTETDTIHAALRAVLVAEEVVADLAAARGERVFRASFIHQMERERRAR